MFLSSSSQIGETPSKNPFFGLAIFTPISSLISFVECGLRLMVPSVVARSRDTQADLVEKLGVGWRKNGENFEVDEVVGELVDKMTCVFLDANRLRRSVLADIMGTLNVYQAASFLEGLAKFYAGFWDPTLLANFKNPVD
uniref:DOG1 domain-containing protein n=1 Tax=Chenopodium quinoa TaxID=63459 RepID=A0A803L6I9_CHEQI